MGNHSDSALKFLLKLHLMSSYSEASPIRATGLQSRVKIGNAFVHSYGFDQVLEAIIEHARVGATPEYVVTPNAQHIVLLQEDRHLQRVYSQALFVLPDGISLVWAARFLGQAITHRVAGVDMFEALCGRAAQHGLRTFFLGGRPTAAERASETLRMRYPGLQVCGISCPPLGFERDPQQQQAVEFAIKKANPHLLFVALGAPKQEYWIYEHARRLGVPIAMGIGGAFEMISGMFKRAPMAFQKVGCEWLYRLALEPRRMWRRYLIGNLQFTSIVLQQRWRI
jgi:N-acetylglucosaminyldiphosphoundecaprenol N-acetyl-beta-D-mannosaminyltransferase